MSLRRVRVQRSNARWQNRKELWQKIILRERKNPGVVRRILPYFVIILVAAALIVAVILITSEKATKIVRKSRRLLMLQKIKTIITIRFNP